MAYRYPYGNTEQMNLDWFLNQWEKFKADWAEAEAGIDGSLDAEIAKVEAAMSELYAARDAAAASASAARQSSLDAAAAQVAAGNSKTAAQAAETAARGSQQAAAQSAQEAQASAQGAENSALTASQAANTATQQAAGADAARGAAEAAQQAAEDAQTTAAQSAGQAGQAATAAADHADDAADSATLAQQAAQDMSDSVEQITTNKNDISDLKESVNNKADAINISKSGNNIAITDGSASGNVSAIISLYPKLTTDDIPTPSTPMSLKLYDQTTLEYGTDLDNLIPVNFVFPSSIYGGEIEIKQDGTAFLHIKYRKFQMSEMTGGLYNVAGRHHVLRFHIPNRLQSGSLDEFKSACTHYSYIGAYYFITIQDNINNLEYALQNNQDYVAFRDDRFEDDSLYPTTEDKLKAFRTLNANMEIVAPITNIQSVELSPVQLKTLLGNNYFNSDNGVITINYNADTKLYIDEKIAELQATLLENIGG